MQNRNKQLKLTIMKKGTRNSEKEYYRITVIFKDEIIVDKYDNESTARDTIKKMKELYPKLFVGAALEEKFRSWCVIWTLGND